MAMSMKEIKMQQQLVIMAPPPINWLDFLLNESLLLPFLQQNSNSDILKLLDEFIRSIPLADSSTNADPGREKKRLVLTTLAIRTAAFLNWDFDILLELSISVQFLLLQYIGNAVGNKSIFCQAFYHRWMLKTLVLEAESNEDEMVLSTISNTIRIQNYNHLKGISQDLEARESSLMISIPTFASILHDNELDAESQLQIPLSVFQSILYFDLGVFALRSTEITDSVGQEYFSKLKLCNTQSSAYFTISTAKLIGYYKLVGIVEPSETETAKLEQIQDQQPEEKLSYAQHIKEKIENFQGPFTDFLPPILSRLIPEPSCDYKFSLIEQLRNATDSCVIEQLINEAYANPALQKPIHHLLPNFPIPNTLKATIMQLESSSLQDYIYLPCVKANELFNMQCYDEYETWLESLKHFLRLKINEVGRSKQCNNTVSVLRRLDIILSWELLLGNTTRTLLKWDIPELLFKESLIKQCNHCLKMFKSSNANTEARPRADVLEAATMFLINCEQYEPIINCVRSNQRWPFLEFLMSLAQLCLRCRSGSHSNACMWDVWNAVLPIVKKPLNEVVRRNSFSGSGTGLLKDLTAFKWVLERAKSPLLVKVFVSLFVKLLNFVAADGNEASIEVELLTAWPIFLDDCSISEGGVARRISGSETLNTALIRELLLFVIDAQRGSETLKYQLVAGHVFLSAKKPFLAMQRYVEYYVEMSHGLEELDPGEKWTEDGYNLLIRSMIRCSYLLGYFIQATLLCQFLTVPDYETSFGMIIDTKIGMEPWENLFQFFWDHILIEYMINFYSKDKQFQERKNRLIKILGDLEMNARNDDEIKKALIRLRKIQFMRTLMTVFIVT